MQKYITVVDNKIKAVFIGNPNTVEIAPGEVIMNVPDCLVAVGGQDVRMWDSEWRLKPLQESVNAGYLTLAEDEYIDTEMNAVYKMSEIRKAELGLIPESECIDGYRLNKYVEISNGYRASIVGGSFQSDALGIKVYCRSSAEFNDLQKLKGIQSFMERNTITEMEYIGCDVTVLHVTSEMLKSLEYEMEDYIMIIDQKYHALEKVIKDATTIAQLKVIKW